MDLSSNRIKVSIVGVLLTSTLVNVRMASADNTNASANNSPTSGKQDLSCGISYYNCEDYEGAETFFRQAIRRQPQDAVAHYYLANALAHLGEQAAALVEYRTCYALCPNGQIGEYAKKAIASSPLKGQPQTSLGESPQARALSTEAEKSLSRIKTQEAVVQEEEIKKGEDRAAAEIRHGELTAAALEKECEIVTQSMKHEIWTDDLGLMSMHRYSAKQIEAVRQDYQRRIERAKEDGKRQAARRKEEAEQAAEHVKQEFASLQDELSKPGTAKAPGSVHLQAVGTNYYVHMYAAPNFKQQILQPQSELEAIQEKLVLDEHSIPGMKKYRIVPTGLSAASDKLATDKGKPAAAIKADLKVEGKLLHL